MSAAPKYAEPIVIEPDEKWSKMSPDERKKYAERVRIKALELMTSRATRDKLLAKDIAERCGYTAAWVSGFNDYTKKRTEALVEYATATGYPLSFYFSMAEDIIALEDEKARQAAGLARGDEQ